MRSMRADDLAKALAGRTTLEEVLRVTPPDPDLARRASRRAAAQEPAQVAQAVKTPPKVLVLDDDHSIAEVAAAVLVDGYEVIAAGQAEEGLRMASSERPDLVLVDLDLPGVDTARLLASVRESAVADLPVLVMSTTDDRPTRARAAAFIPKPFGEAELRSEVAALLQRQPALIEHPARPGLQEPEVPGVVVVDRAGAGRAVPAGLQGGAAGEVAEALGVGGAGAVGAPLGEQAEGAGQLAAGGGQLVGEPGRAARVRLADQHHLPLQVLEALGEDVGGDAGEGLQQLVEAPRALQEGLDQQQGPAVPHPGHRLVQRRGGRRGPHGLGHGAIVGPGTVASPPRY
jgi:CheY-like chemotaxis protein